MPNPMRLRAIAGLKAGDSFVVKRAFRQEDTNSFGDLTRDYNPVHYEERWSEEKGFKGLICHGLLIGAMICEFGGQVGWLATGMNFKFIKPVYFNEEITCTITITKVAMTGRAEAEAIYTNGTGEQVGLAHMTGRLPIKDECHLLERMVSEGDQTNKLNDFSE